MDILLVEKSGRRIYLLETLIATLFKNLKKQNFVEQNMEDDTFPSQIFVPTEILLRHLFGKFRKEKVERSCAIGIYFWTGGALWILN